MQSALDPGGPARPRVDGLAGQRGSVVAIVPSTGEVRAMVSIPEYDPNRDPERLRAAQPRRARRFQPRHPGRLPAGLDDEGRDRDRGAGQRRVHAGLDAQRPLPERDRGRAAGRTPAASSSATIDMTTALTNSVNTWWAQVGEKLGKDTMFKYMDRFGFNAEAAPRLPELPARRQRRLRREQAARPERPDRHRPGRDRPGAPARDAAADGGGRGAVANKGELMEPRLWSKVIDPDGRETKLDPAASEPSDERGHRVGAQRR